MHDPGTVAAVSSTFYAVDPRTGTPGAAFEEATPADVHAAVSAASEVFRPGALRDNAERAALLRGPASRLRAAARERPIPVFAEMGSINPIVVTEAALRERAQAIAEGLTTSVASFGGQLCTKPGVVFVPAGEAGDAFTADLGERLRASEPQGLLNERLRDALTTSVATLGELADPVAG